MRLKLPSNEQLLFLVNILANKLFFKQNIKKSLKEILIIKLDEIGDMAVSTHVFQLLKNEFPEAKITLVCKSFLVPLIKSDPNLDCILEHTNFSFRKFDAIIEMRGTWQTLFKALLNIGCVRLSRAEVRLKNKGQQLHEIETNYQIIKPILSQQVNIKPKLYYSENDETIVGQFILKNDLHNFAVFHVGARRKLRQWNLDRFAIVADFLVEKRQMEIVFIGTKSEENDIHLVQNFMKNDSTSFTDGFSLAQLSVLMSKTNLFIGNESGPIHIASCFNVPIVGLYGPGVPVVFYPFSEKNKVFHYVLDCNPCDQIHCVRPDSPCISLIQVSEVLEYLEGN